MKLYRTSIKKYPKWKSRQSTKWNCLGCSRHLDTHTKKKRTQERTGTHACDLIDRQAAIDAVERNSCNTQRAIDAVNALPSAQRWIPTSKKLPDELAEVNVTWENTEPEPYYDFIKGHYFTGTAVYFRGRWYWYSAVCVDYLREYGFSPNDEMDDAIKVIAWMPLPEPWRGEQDEHND